MKEGEGMKKGGMGEEMEEWRMSRRKRGEREKEGSARWRGKGGKAGAVQCGKHIVLLAGAEAHVMQSRVPPLLHTLALFFCLACCFALRWTGS